MILHEAIKYKHNLPFSANFINVREEPGHCHKEVEILLLLRGFSHCKIYHMDYALQPGDMIIADVEDLHRIHDSSEDVLMLQVHIDTNKFEEIYPNISATYFVCEDPGALHENDAALKEKQLSLKHQLAKLVMDSVGNPNDFVLHSGNINDVIATLIRHFRGFYMEDYQYRVGRNNVSDVDLDRMSRITSYLLRHFDKKVTLEDIAATEHLNPYYVSHLIKNTLGIPFQNFVNGIRLEFAEKNLLFTDQSLTQVAENCGFSSLNYFNKCFYAWYGLTPSQYRKRIIQTGRLTGLSFTEPEALDLVGKFLTPVVAIKRLRLAPALTYANAPAPMSALHQLSSEESQLRKTASFSPMILIRTQEDLLGLGFLNARIHAIKPAAFLVNRRLLTPLAYGILQTFGIPVEPVDASLDADFGLPVQNTAMALAHITGQTTGTPPVFVPLFGGHNALFLPEGLATPLYTGYQILSGLRGDSIMVSSQMLISRSDDESTAILYNPDPRAILNVHLETKNLPEQFVLMKKQITEDNNCYSILEALGRPTFLPPEVVREIDQSHLGLPQFLMVERAVSPVLDFMIYPQHVMMLVFSTLTDSSLR
jgi:AraC-like DNA-binding protein